MRGIATAAVREAWLSAPSGADGNEGAAGTVVALPVTVTLAGGGMVRVV